MNVTLCGNCNTAGRTFNVEVRTSPPVYNQTAGPRFHDLCEKCKDAVVGLDFATFLDRHESRPRALDLP